MIVVANPPRAVTGKVAGISVGGEHACIYTKSFDVYCWGDNSFGQLGIGTTLSTTAPASFVPGLDDGIDGSFPAVVGARHSCALGYGLGSSGFHMMCWGDNSSGQLGNGTTTNSMLPVGVARAANGDVIGSSVVSAGGSHTCGFSAGRAYCWGANGAGQLGNGATTSSAIPVAVGGPSFDALSAGTEHTCGTTTAGTVYCWGSNTAGQLGDGTVLSSALPVPVMGDLRFSMVTAGDRYTCGVTQGGAAYCWGANGAGQLGNGTTTGSAVPVAVSGGHFFARIATASNHACALTFEQGVYCWGANDKGQLGDGTMTASSTPTWVQGLEFFSVSVGGNSSCGVSPQGVAYCWGDNRSGQLGDGSTVNSAVPVKVADGCAGCKR